MVHIQNTTITNTAMVCSIGLPDIAHFAVPPAFCLIAHVKAPVWWNKTWICHNALIKSYHQVGEQNVIQEEDHHSIQTPKLRDPNNEDEGSVNAENDTQDGGNEAHAIDALRGERPCSLHGCEDGRGSGL